MLRRRSSLLRQRSICKTSSVARDDRLFLHLAATGHYLVRILERQLEPTGIPPYQLALVTHVRHHQPVTPTEISRASGVPPTTLRDNIRRLVDAGLVRRAAHPTDGRSYRLELTPRGELMACAADPALADAYERLERLLPEPLARYESTVVDLNTALERTLAELGPDGSDNVRGAPRGRSRGA
jgi:DNA-binding MarR family transcriptional regulator